MTTSHDYGAESFTAPHIALFPNAGMGHLMPYLRLATTLLGRRCRVTLITPSPTLMAAESAVTASFLLSYPEVSHHELRLIPDDDNTTSGNPYFLRFGRIARSIYLIRPLLSSVSPPLSAVVSDLLAASQAGPILADLGLPLYILWTSSAKLTALVDNLSSDPSRFNSSLSQVDFPADLGIPPLPIESVPPPFFSPDHILTHMLVTNARALHLAKGILINTFEGLEHETLKALNHSRIENGMPPLLAIGPLELCRMEPPKTTTPAQAGDYKRWLDCQPADSVVYVCFGSKDPIEVAQIQELGKGLMMSGVRFLWAVKSRELSDKADGVRELLGDSIGEDLVGRGRGMVVSEWVDQDEILGSPAVGGFVSHCGWNSVAEAAAAGVPVLAWPQNGDQGVNAHVVEESGLGIFPKNWGIGNGHRNGPVKGEEIGEKIRDFMKNEGLRARARRIGEAAEVAVGVGGSSHATLTGVLREMARRPPDAVTVTVSRILRYSIPVSA
ncbi:hypothetical protein SAY87_021238 [Trapa incisa]|uniref:Glycosyltransferase n=1 Tax=Trapa incisa TaxID=236973 RepID=A0AAN7JT03_9MYRT|nr:hypothetical protein SAY87_021238 [Trapa incisa]